MRLNSKMVDFFRNTDKQSYPYSVRFSIASDVEKSGRDFTQYVDNLVNEYAEYLSSVTGISVDYFDNIHNDMTVFGNYDGSYNVGTCYTDIFWSMYYFSLNNFVEACNDHGTFESANRRAKFCKLIAFAVRFFNPDESTLIDGQLAITKSMENYDPSSRRYEVRTRGKFGRMFKVMFPFINEQTLDVFISYWNDSYGEERKLYVHHGRSSAHFYSAYCSDRSAAYNGNIVTCDYKKHLSNSCMQYTLERNNDDDDDYDDESWEEEIYRTYTHPAECYATDPEIIKDDYFSIVYVTDKADPHDHAAIVHSRVNLLHKADTLQPAPVYAASDHAYDLILKYIETEFYGKGVDFIDSDVDNFDDFRKRLQNVYHGGSDWSNAHLVPIDSESGEQLSKTEWERYSRDNADFDQYCGYTHHGHSFDVILPYVDIFAVGYPKVIGDKVYCVLVPTNFDKIDCLHHEESGYYVCKDPESGEIFMTTHINRYRGLNNFPLKIDFSNLTSCACCGSSIGDNSAVWSGEEVQVCTACLNSDTRKIDGTYYHLDDLVHINYVEPRYNEVNTYKGLDRSVLNYIEMRNRRDVSKYFLTEEERDQFIAENDMILINDQDTIDFGKWIRKSNVTIIKDDVTYIREGLFFDIKTRKMYKPESAPVYATLFLSTEGANTDARDAVFVDVETLQDALDEGLIQHRSPTSYRVTSKYDAGVKSLEEFLYDDPENGIDFDSLVKAREIYRDSAELYRPLIVTTNGNYGYSKGSKVVNPRDIIYYDKIAVESIHLLSKENYIKVFGRLPELITDKESAKYQIRYRTAPYNSEMTGFVNSTTDVDLDDFAGVYKYE